MSQVKISPRIPPAHRKALKDFVKNPLVAARVVTGEFDHLLPPAVKEQLVKDRAAFPALVTIAMERIERGIKEGKLSPMYLAKHPDPLGAGRRQALTAEATAAKAARKAKYGN